MATLTLGTNANNSIPYSLTHSQAVSDADMATISQHILNDGNRTPLAVGGSYTKAGTLLIPRRGWLDLLPGDVVGVTTRGWPILLSADEIANGLWTRA